MILALGAWLRVWNAGGRPFWRDEACVADAVRTLSYSQLMRQTDLPLPPLFALAAKAAAEMPWAAEWTLRIPSVLAGCLLPLIVYRAARLLRAPRGMALCGAAAAATSLASVIWSRELKQYSFEALVAAVAAMLILSLADGNRVRPTKVAGLLLLALAAPWLGYGLILPLAALLAGAIVMPTRRAAAAGVSHRLRIVWVMALLALGASAIGVWVTVAGAQSSDEALRKLMQPWLIEAGNPRSWVRMAFYQAVTIATLVLSLNWLGVEGDRAALTLVAALVLAGVMAVGVWHWPRAGRRYLLWWLLAPLAAMLAAAALGKYPFGQVRMMQVWTPPALLALGAGLYGLARLGVRMIGGPRGAALLVALALSLAPAAIAADETLRHRHFVLHEFPCLLEHVRQERVAGELVLSDAMSAACVRYYAPALGAPKEIVVLTSGTLPRPGTDFYRDAAERARFAKGRIWWLTTDEALNGPDRAAFEARLRALGYRMRSVAKGAGAGTLGGAAELLVAER
jgi:hypothetical protein